MPNQINEFNLIEKYFAPLSGVGAFSLKDDAALLSFPKGKSLVVTNDAIAEGVHFLKNTDPKLIAQKALRTNLSDLAAKGAKPFSFTSALGLSNKLDENWIKKFAKGLESDCKKFGLSLCGGDTFSVESGVVISVTAFGTVDKKHYPPRTAAKKGDHLFVTGSIGNSVLGLTVSGSKSGPQNVGERAMVKRYQLPLPRLEFQKAIAKYASAAMDISDGFVGDLDKICVASNLSIELESSQIPIENRALKIAAKRKISASELLTGGDDYELFISVPKKSVEQFKKATSKIKVPITQLGTFETETKPTHQLVTILGSDGKAMKFKGRSYAHFGS